MKEVSRYHPLLVALHWLLALLVIASMTIGFFLLPAMSNSDPRKLNILMLHMAGGMLILALTSIRLVVRLRTRRPAELTTGYPSLDTLVPICHYGFYVLVVLMVATGYATAILAGLNKIAFMSSGDPLPDDLMIYPTSSDIVPIGKFARDLTRQYRLDKTLHRRSSLNSASTWGLV